MKAFLTTWMIVGMLIGAAHAAEPISDDAKALAITIIKGYESVVDASIRQKGRQVKLVLLVDYGTSVQHARRMGDHFIRILKSYGPDASPGHQIGPGIYDYFIGVAMPSRTRLGEGIKLGSSHDLQWLSRSDHLASGAGEASGSCF